MMTADLAVVEAIGSASDAAARRERVIIAADELLSEVGLDGFTIRAVLLRTGLARRALYESFGSKDDLVLAVFERALRGAADHFAALLHEIDDPLERIRVIVVGIVLGPFGVDDRSGTGEQVLIDRRSAAFSREHLRLAEARPADLAQALRPLLELIAAQVAAGMRSGSLREGDPVLVAKLIYNLMATTTHFELLAPERSLDADRQRVLAGAIWEFCRRAITA